MSLTKISLAVSTYRLLKNSRLDGGEAKGNITLDPSSRALLDELAENEMMLRVDHSGTPDGAAIDIEFSVPRSDSGFFAEDWESFLANNNYRFTPPSDFFIKKDDFLFSENTDNISAKRYKAIHTLIDLLRSAADYEDCKVGSLKLIFLLNKKFDLPLEYEFGDFRDTPGIDLLAAEFSGAASNHRDQRKMILKVVLHEMLGSAIADNRFELLLKNFPDFVKRVRDGYELYVAEFSFEKILEQVSASKLEYTIKMNKVFSDIQNQLLAIPAALILIGSQMMDKASFDWKNTIIIFGCLIFVLLMNFLIRNQRNSLDAIRMDFEKEAAHLKSRHLAVESKFSDQYDSLESRYKQQYRLLVTVDALVAAMFLFCVGLYFWYSFPHDYWLKYIPSSGFVY